MNLNKNLVERVTLQGLVKNLVERVTLRGLVKNLVISYEGRTKIGL
jgi:hypothetical protein